MSAVLPDKWWYPFVGTSTLMTRFWVALHTLALGLMLDFGRVGVFAALRRGDRYLYLPLECWQWMAYILSALMIWRVVRHRSRPRVAWCINSATVLFWGAIVVGRVQADGWSAAASGATATFLMAAWVLLRTEATLRDTEQA
jgi:hypothetical protein